MSDSKDYAARFEARAFERIPRHLAVIMDGNNRWARGRMMGAAAGHKAGVKSLRKTVECSAKAGVEALTLYAFSSENWQRPDDEVRALLDLFAWALDKEVHKLVRNNLRLRIIGDRSGFSRQIQASIERAEALTADNTGMLIVVAANYGGQWDIAQAARRLAEEVARGERSPEEINPDLMAGYLSLSDLPAPDLCIRTAGEQRVSNFLLWQLAYTELHFSPVLWPDFDAQALSQAFDDFAGRQRRFGGRSVGKAVMEK